MNKVMQKYLEVLPLINEAKGYGESTKLIRQHVDEYFGKGEHETKVTYYVQVQMTTTKTVTIEAFSQDIAEEKGLEEVKRDYLGDYEDIEVVNIWEKTN